MSKYNGKIVTDDQGDLVVTVASELSLWEMDCKIEGTMDSIKVDTNHIDGVIYHEHIPETIEYLQAICEKYKIKKKKHEGNDLVGPADC